MKILLAVWLLILNVSWAAAQQDDVKMLSIRDFVSVEYIHGVPYDQAKKYSSTDVPELISMLANPEMKPFWRNIIWALGAIGNDEALNELIEFSTSRFKGEVDNHTFSALIQVQLAIGVLAHRSDAAFNYLERAANPNHWADKPVSWTYFTLKPGETRLLMTQLSINGLGLTGRQEAVSTLKGVADKLNPKEIELYFVDNLKEAEQNAARSASQGLEAVLTTSNKYGG